MPVRQIISRAVASEGVIDIFAAAGLEKPDISILSEEFLAEVRGMPQRNLAVELLQKLLKGELATRRKKNVVQARSFAEMLEQTLRRYQNRAVEAAQVIEELIRLARELREATARGEKLGLSEDELAFYDALETNDSAVQVLGDVRRPRVFLDTPLTYSRSERRVTMGKVTRGSVGAERARASGAPTDPSTTSRGRFSVQKKTAAVLRMMRGESLDIVSRDLGVTAGRLSEWRDQFHAGAQAALRARPSDDRDEKVKDLQAKVGELTMDNELLQQKIERLEARRPLMHRRSQK